MIDKSSLESLVSKMTHNLTENSKLLEESLVEFGVTREELLISLTSHKFDEKLCYLAVESLLMRGRCNLNVKDNNGCTFLHNVINQGYNETFVKNIIERLGSFNRCDEFMKFNFNSEDIFGNTILHTAVTSNAYKGSIFDLYYSLVDNKFDSKLATINLKDFFNV